MPVAVQLFSCLIVCLCGAKALPEEVLLALYHPAMLLVVNCMAAKISTYASPLIGLALCVAMFSSQILTNSFPNISSAPALGLS